MATSYYRIRVTYHDKPTWRDTIHEYRTLEKAIAGAAEQDAHRDKNKGVPIYDFASDAIIETCEKTDWRQIDPNQGAML